MESQLSVKSVSRLSALFTMAHFVEITLPSTFAIDGIASEGQLQGVYDHVIKIMADHFGGVTLIEGQGAWYSSDLRKVISEGVKIAKSYCIDLDDPSVSVMIDLAEYIKVELSQESVLISLDGIAYMV